MPRGGTLACLLACLANCLAQALQPDPVLDPHLISDETITSTLLFVGVQTTYATDRNRKVLRQTWFPSTQKALDELQAGHNLTLRFVIGSTTDPQQEAALAAERAQHGGFLMLPWAERSGGNSSSAKTHAFLLHALLHTRAAYIVRMEEGVYLQPRRLALVARQWEDADRDYVGCFFHASAVMKDGAWAEDHHRLFPGKYHTYAQGGMYALSRKALENLGEMPGEGNLRYFNNEDVTVGLWMALLLVNHYDDQRLCELDCTTSSVAVRQLWCGSKDNRCWPVEYQLNLHNRDKCGTVPVSDYKYYPTLDSKVTFDRGRHKHRRYRITTRRRRQPEAVSL